MLYALPAQAVHDDNLFELEGNTTDAASTPNLDDWQNLYSSGGSAASHIQGCTSVITASCFETFSFSPDPAAGDTSYFTQGGSKDRNDVSQWLYTANDQTPDKNDITNAFAASYRNAAAKLQVYFGADRFAVNGDAQMGFWFFQRAVCLAGTTTDGVACPNTHPGAFVDPDTGDFAHHVNGDVLALVNFNNGGAIGLAGVYVWSGDDPNTTTVEGAPVQALFGTGADCKSIGPNDSFCTTANTAALSGEPYWPYLRKGGGSTYQTSAFMEGGIDLGAVQGAGSCFSTFLAETRSSGGPSSGLSLDAQLKDFTLDTFERCGATLTTTPKDGAGSAIPAGGLSIGTGSVTAKDSAALDVSGIDTWSGNLKYFLCGPIATDATCSTGGLQIGPAAGVTVNQSSPASAFLSDAATLTSAANGTTAAPGRYCWRGVFTSATSGVPSRTDSSAGECFSVKPVTPGLDTQAVASSVNFGSAIQDNATLGTGTGVTSTATQPGTNGPNATYPTINATNGAPAGGKITFTLFGPSSTGCGTQTSNSTTAGDTNPQDVNVSGNGTYGPVSYTPGAPGTYHWKAAYAPASGDPNNLGSTHNSACDDTDEDVVVNQVNTSVATRQWVYPNDKATISAPAGGNLAGSVQFKLYGAAGGNTALANCQANGDTVGQGGLLYKPTASSISGASPQSAATSNSTVAVTSDATVVWRVTYTSTNQAQLGSSSACVESTAVDFTGDDGNISVP
jgi:hypothetical protein